MKICGEVVLEYLNLDKILRCSGVVCSKEFYDIFLMLD